MTRVQNHASVLIRPPRSTEWPACRMLLPEAFDRGASPECLLAVSPAGPGIVGAAAVRWHDQTAYAVRIRVIRTQRRLRIGSRLFQVLLAGARRRGIRQMVAAVGPRIEAAAEPFLRAWGFVRANRLTTVEAPIAGMRDMLGALRRRLVERGKIPACARSVWLPEAPPEEIGRLYAAHIVHDPDFPLEAVLASMSAGRIDGSPVLLVDGRVEGMLLWEREDDLIKVHARVVTPRFQGGWANVLLLSCGIERAWSEGGRRVQFESLDTNKDTLKLAERFQARVVAVRERWVRELSEEGRHGQSPPDERA